MIQVASGGSGGKREVQAGRRRKPQAAPPGGRERAEAPRREGSPGSKGAGGGGPGGVSGFGGRSPMRLPAGKGCLSGGSIAVVLLIVVIIFAVRGCGGLTTEDGTGNGVYTGQIAQVSSAGDFITDYPDLTDEIPARANQTWLVMLYQDADDKILEKDIYLDLNEAEKAGASDRVKVVAQVDRHSGAYSADGDWTGTKRFLITQDDDLGRVISQEVADLGEANMASGQTLADFATWAIKTYPADKYVLILSDHGMGWPGGWTDPVPKGTADTSIPMQARLGDLLYMSEMDDALGRIRSQTGLDKFEMIGLDACLMGQLEVFTALEPHARYAVASEETEPALGWAYTDFLNALNQDPDMGGGELSQLVVKGYIQSDQMILDSGARAEMLSRSSPLGGLYGDSTQVSPQQLAREMGQSSTLTAVDLSRMAALNASVNKLAYAFRSADQRSLASSRSYAQSFTSVFGSQAPPSYIDLGHFLQLLKQKTTAAAVSQAADGVLAALQHAVIAEKHGPQKPGATGMSIYFPNSQLYQNPIAGAQSYTAIAGRFATASLWDDFLGYHYANQGFAETDARPVVPPASAVRSPAAGAITISGVSASSAAVAAGETVTLSADIDGRNIGHIYLSVGFHDQASGSVFVADRDFLEASGTRQVDGVYYPDWGEGEFALTFDWEPVVFAISDGETTAEALFQPEDYGRTAEEAVYSVDGVYTFGASGERLPARLYFIDGVMRQACGFTGETDASAPREITPAAGDRFTVLEQWLDVDSSGQAVGTSSQEGKTLTFGEEMLTMETLDAAPGDYVVGFVVEDLDGHRQQAFTSINVT